MEEMNPAKVVKRVRQRLEVSQEGLARLLNATKGAVQHWERGRNRPDLARLLALRPLCPVGAEKKELETLIKETQGRVAPLPTAQPGPDGKITLPQPGDSVMLLRRENNRMRKQLAKLEATLRRREEKLRILEDLAKELQREMASLRAGQSPEAPEPAAPEPSASAVPQTTAQHE
jgi:transcriptional regulator with XRE-family HTH domain